MNRFRCVAVCLASALGLMLALSMLAVGAYAQTTPPVLEYKIDFRPLLDQVVWPALALAATALAGWIATAIKGWLNLKNDDIVRGYLDTALQNAVTFAQSKVGDRPMGVTVKSQMVADASNYALSHVPDALKRFGIDQDGLKRMLEARLG